MYEDLSKSQKAILKYIIKTTTTRGYPPSVREICRAVGLKSTSSVHNNLEKLQSFGYIRRDPSKPRAIEVLKKYEEEKTKGLNSLTIPIPVIKKTSTQINSIQDEDISEYIKLPTNLIGEKGDKFIHRISGDSMKGIGINDGDLAIIQRNPHAKNRDIVLALIDGGSLTLKRYFDEGDKIVLKPENMEMDPLFFNKSKVEILGKLIAIIRKY